MAKVVLKGFIMVPAKILEQVKKEIEIHKEFTLREPGCMAFKVEQSEKDPCRFDVYEEFVDKVAFEAHQERAKSSKWGKLTANAKRVYEIIE